MEGSRNEKLCETAMEGDAWLARSLLTGVALLAQRDFSYSVEHCIRLLALLYLRYQGYLVL